MLISIILPVYNPAAGWADVVLAETARLAQSMSGIQFEYIVVNDGSVNEAYLNEKDKLTGTAIKVIECAPNRGKGEALRTGVHSSSGEIVIYTDIDFPYTIQSVQEVANMLVAGSSDVVIGIKDSSYYDHVPGFRRFASKLLRLFARLFFRIPTDDFMCGLKGFNLKGKPVFLQTTVDRYLFDLEFMVLLSRRRDIITTTQEVRLKEEVKFRKMNPSLIVSELKDLFSILLRSYTA